MNTLLLQGCTPEPLMGYLKALGIFRLVSEQKDPACRAAWRDGHLVLQTTLTKEALIEFLYKEYIPTPVVVPWSGNDFFGITLNNKKILLDKTPTGSAVIQAFLLNESGRLSNYRAALLACLESLRVLGISKKEQVKGKEKAAFLAFLRTVSIANLDDWIDAASALPNEELKLNTLLGSGGGSDGNTHFSDNFMQNLWDVLPSFEQDKVPDEKKIKKLISPAQSIELLRCSLLNSLTSALVKGRTSSLYHSGGVGGPNAGQGFERESFSNPWDFILAIEGCVAFAGSVARKLGASRGHAAFPFQTRASAIDGDSFGDGETAGQEVWLPLWHRACCYRELKVLLSEGRSEWQGEPSERGVDFAKAVASLGVDRGIGSFARYGILKGRVGGDNYNTAAFLGRFDVQSREDVHLLREADAWIERYRQACGDLAPVRFHKALRRMDSAVFDFCRFGGSERFQTILFALGDAERELATAPKLRKDKALSPLRNLSSDWVKAAADVSPEFEIALALAGIAGAGSMLGLRENLEPVAQGEKGLAWSESSRAYIWQRGSLVENLAAALERRTLDAVRHGLEQLPIASCCTVRPETAAAFLAGAVDDDKIERLLRGLVCCKIEPRSAQSGNRRQGPLLVGNPPLPRSYAVLKATLSGLHAEAYSTSGASSRDAHTLENLRRVKPDARLLQLLRAGRAPEATAVAAQRLRHQDLAVADIAWGANTLDHEASAQRLAAALLLPIAGADLLRLWRLVERRQKHETAEESAATDTFRNID